MTKASAAAQIRALVEALVETGWQLWLTAHNNTPAAQLVQRWMRDVVPGYFVLEITSAVRTIRAINRVGTLLSTTSTTSGHKYTIRTIDGRERRWQNASFVRIPRNANDNRELFLLGEQSV